MSAEEEIGYLCGIGHYLFAADSGDTESCGSKRVAGIYLRWEAGDDDRGAGDPLWQVKEYADRHLREVIETWRQA